MQVVDQQRLQRRIRREARVAVAEVRLAEIERADDDRPVGIVIPCQVGRVRKERGKQCGPGEDRGEGLVERPYAETSPSCQRCHPQPGEQQRARIERRHHQRGERERQARQQEAQPQPRQALRDTARAPRKQP